MALHPEINPSPEGLPLSIAAAALRAARSSKTSHSGSAYFETGSTADGDGVGIVTGPMAAEHGGIGRLDDEGVLHPLVDLEPLEQAAQAAQAQADSVREQAEKDAQTLREQMSKVAADADKASEQAQELAQSALDAANKADGKADTITTTVNGHESKLKDLSASLESTRKTADGALEKSSKVEASIGELSATLTRDYTPTSKADAKYAAKTELTATAEGLQSKITQAATTADSAVETANSAKSTADKNTATISQVSKTAQGALDKASSVEQSLDGFKTSVSQDYETKSDALSKQSSLQQSLEGFKTTVAETYLTKNDAGSMNLLPNGTFDDGISGWTVLGGSACADSTGINGTKALRFNQNAAGDYNHRIYTNNFNHEKGKSYTVTFIARASQPINLHVGAGAATEDIEVVPIDIQDRHFAVQYTAKNNFALTIYLENAGTLVLSVVRVVMTSDLLTATNAKTLYTSKTDFQQTTNSITSSVSATAKAAQSALDKASTVEQTASGLSSRISEVAKTASGAVTTANEAKSTADKNTATISQVSKTAQGALDKASSVEQSLDGFKTTVSQTYTTRDATLLRYKITGANGAAWVHLGDWNNSSNAYSCEIVFYTGNGYNGQSHQNSTAHIFIQDGWQSTASTSKAFGVTVTLDNADENTLQVLVLASSHNACSVWVRPAWEYWNGFYTVVCSGGSWTHTGEHQSDKPTGAEQEVAYRPNAGANAQAISSIRSDLDTQYTKKSEFNITTDGFESRISTTESRIDATSQTVVNEIHDRQRYMRFSDSTGKPTLELGASDSSNKMVLTNDRLEFRVNDNAVAYLGNDRMNINNAEIKSVLVLGKYAFMPRDNGNISLQYIG